MAPEAAYVAGMITMFVIFMIVGAVAQPSTSEQFDEEINTLLRKKRDLKQKDDF